jgi:MoaA/NifB/PqqE/SkfB family radical SAM enzyme
LSKNRLAGIIKDCRNAGINFKVNTVVSNLSKKELKDMGLFFSKNPPTIWKLRQFVPRSGGFEVRKKYFISNTEFKEIISWTKDAFPKIKIESKTIAEQSGTCLMIFPDGKIAKPSGKGFEFCGNALKEDLRVVWEKCFSKAKQELHYKNFEKTYTT